MRIVWKLAFEQFCLKTFLHLVVAMLFIGPLTAYPQSIFQSDGNRTLSHKQGSIDLFQRNGKLLGYNRYLQGGSAFGRDFISREKQGYLAENNLSSGWMETEEIVQTWSGSSWLNSQRVGITYDIQGRRTVDLNQTWNGISWVTSYRDSITYGDQGRMTSYLFQNWSGAAWVTFDRDTISYDSAGRETIDLYQSWHGGSWSDYERLCFVYNQAGRITSDVNQIWSNATWMNYLQRMYTYDSDGRQTDGSYQFWNDTAWITYAKDTIIYDALGFETSAVYQSWNDTTWVISGRNIFAYDENGNEVTLLYQTWNDTTWLNSNQVVYTWSKTTAVTDNRTLPLHDDLWENYPNPFNPSTQIRYTLGMESTVTLKIYDILGNEIATLVNGRKQAGEHTVTWNARNVPSGVYFYTIMAGEFIQTKKMVVTK